MALALYRKYRPRTFAEIIGQEHVTEPLSQALRTGRLHHAYLFSGPRGCGKTSSARILARSLNCVKGPTPDPCGECDSCRALAPDGAGSIDVIEIDAASHGGVDDARDLRERAFFAPVSSRYKIYVIDEAHMVSSAGFNALLKLVEEPPDYVKFVFATTEPEKVLGTIKSRTHHYPFRLIPPGVLRPYLESLCAAEGVAVQPAVFPLVVRAGAGSARDTLSVLDQLIAGAGPEGVTYARAVALLGVTDAALIDEMCDALAAGDGAAAYATIDRVAEAGHDPRRFAGDLLERLRDLIVLQQVPDAVAKGLLAGADDELERMATQAERFGPATLSRMADIVHTGLTDMRGTTAPRLVLELITARMLLPGAEDSTAALLQRLERMERRLTLSAGDTAPISPVRGGTGPAPADTEPPAVAPPAPARSGRPASASPAGPADTAPTGTPDAASPATAPTSTAPTGTAATGTAATGTAATGTAATGTAATGTGPTDAARTEDASAAAPGEPARPAARSRRTASAAPTEPPAPPSGPSPAAIGGAGATISAPTGSAPTPNGTPTPGAPTSSGTPTGSAAGATPRAEAPITGAVDAVAVRRIWDEVLTMVRRKSPRAAAVVREAVVRDVDGDTVVLSFKHQFHAQAVEADHALLVEALHELLDGRWQIRCEISGEAGGVAHAGGGGSGRGQAPPRQAPSAPATRSAPPPAAARGSAREPGSPATAGGAPDSGDDDDWPTPAPLGGSAASTAPSAATSTVGAPPVAGAPGFPSAAGSTGGWPASGPSGGSPVTDPSGAPFAAGPAGAPSAAGPFGAPPVADSSGPPAGGPHGAWSASGPTGGSPIAESGRPPAGGPHGAWSASGSTGGSPVAESGGSQAGGPDGAWSASGPTGDSPVAEAGHPPTAGASGYPSATGPSGAASVAGPSGFASAAGPSGAASIAEAGRSSTAGAPGSPSAAGPSGVPSASRPAGAPPTAPAPRSGRSASGRAGRAASGRPTPPPPEPGTARAAARAAAAGKGPKAPAGARHDNWGEEPPYDPEFDGPVRPAYEGFAPGDEPDDEVDAATARQTSEQQALELLRNALGAEKIGEGNA